jgi:hypothetical protein
MHFMFIADKDGNCYHIVNLDQIINVIPAKEREGKEADPNETWLVGSDGRIAAIPESFETFKGMLNKYITDAISFSEQVSMERQRIVQEKFVKEMVDAMKKW